MAGKSSVFRNDLLKLIFNAVTIAGLARDDLSPITTLYVSLHTADPSAGDQSTSQVTYTGYARVAVLRTSAGWVVTAAEVSPANNIEFPISTAGATQTATFVGIGTAASGAGKLLFSGALTPSITINVGTIPRLTSASKITEV